MARTATPLMPGDPAPWFRASALDGSPTYGFEDAQRWHREMVAHGIRLGQPVKCVRLPDGRWGATLRIGLAMWQVADRAHLDDRTLALAFAGDMRRIADAFAAVHREEGLPAHPNAS